MRILQGTISGLKMAKTVTVTITRYKKHPKYQKRFRVTKKYHAHCEDELRKDLKIGDSVYILESKPLSKIKKWILVTEESRKALIEQDRGTQASKAGKKTEIKNISDKQSITLEHTKRKMNSNKRKTLAAAAPAPSPAPAAEPVAEK
ncbi:MAG: 30S ribosomal protein S17, partial [Candidatus Gracilibacteria bacterium]|nr:30S ribosomal protein S17 [Candidatus Gracilibacteria bacterium]